MQTVIHRRWTGRDLRGLFDDGRPRPIREPLACQDGVTPEMIAAGMEVYLEHCPDTGDATVDRNMIREVWVAMNRANRA